MSVVEAKDIDMTTLRFEVSGLNCGACAARAERAMAGVPGVTSATVNLADHTATVQAPSRLAQAVAQASTGAGYPAKAMVRGAERHPQDDETPALARATILAAALTLPIFVMEMGGHLFPALHHLIGRTIGM